MWTLWRAFLIPFHLRKDFLALLPIYLGSWVYSSPKIPVRANDICKIPPSSWNFRNSGQNLTWKSVVKRDKRMAHNAPSAKRTIWIWMYGPGSDVTSTLNFCQSTRVWHTHHMGVCGYEYEGDCFALNYKFDWCKKESSSEFGRVMIFFVYKVGIEKCVVGPFGFS